MTERAIQRMQERWVEADALAIDRALNDLMKSYEGRKFLWWLLQIGKIGAQPFNGNALGTAFGCGELNVGQQILDRITFVNSAGYVAMMQEQANERSDRDTELRNAAGGQPGEPNPDGDA